MCPSRRAFPSGRPVVPPAQAGVTLLELVLAVGIGGMVCLGLGYVYALNTGLMIRSQVKLAMHVNGTRVLEEIRQAASHAEVALSDGRDALRLAYPPSPLGGSAPGDTVFQLKENVLFRNGARLAPSVGDTLIRVAGFRTITDQSEGGPPTLKVQLDLYAIGVDGKPGDTMHFETAVHARNRDMPVENEKTEVPATGRKEFF